jgi:hypothetical protein
MSIPREKSMAEMAQMRQEDYERRRRARVLGMAIDQCIQGMKNIIVYSDVKFWHEDNKPRCDDIKVNGTSILQDLLDLERQLLQLANIYASMIPDSKELEQYRELPASFDPSAET